MRKREESDNLPSLYMTTGYYKPSKGVPRCTECNVILDADNRYAKRLLCKPCGNALARMKGKPLDTNVAQPHPLAYLMIIRDRYDKELYKSNDEYDMFDTVYRVPDGHLLPAKYADLLSIYEIIEE